MKITHCWIIDGSQEEVKEELSKYYTGLEVIACKHDNFRYNALYHNKEVLINFYSTLQADEHLKRFLWCGLQFSKVIITAPINVESLHYLMIRLRMPNELREPLLEDKPDSWVTLEGKSLKTPMEHRYRLGGGYIPIHDFYTFTEHRKNRDFFLEQVKEHFAGY